MTGRPHSLLLLGTELQNSQGLSRVCLAGWSILPFLLRPLLCHGSFSGQTLFLAGYTGRGGDGGERETALGGAEGLVFSDSSSDVNHLTSVSPSGKWDQAPQRTWQLNTPGDVQYQAPLSGLRPPSRRGVLTYRKPGALSPWSPEGICKPSLWPVFGWPMSEELHLTF